MFHIRVHWGEDEMPGRRVLLSRAYTDEERTEFIRKNGIAEWYAPCLGVHDGIVVQQSNRHEASAFEEGMMMARGKFVSLPGPRKEQLDVCQRLGCEVEDLELVDQPGAYNVYTTNPAPTTYTLPRRRRPGPMYDGGDDLPPSTPLC